jgi:diphosphomevalonate decarboxylase
VESKDFSLFSELTMKDSNQLHAVCLDTYPPCVYMNEVSHAVSSLVHQINQIHGANVVISFISNLLILDF